MRLSIEITREQHQSLKKAAALHGQTIKDYVLARTLSHAGPAAALAQLDDFLKPRVEEALRGERVGKSVDDIVTEPCRSSIPHNAGL